MIRKLKIALACLIVAAVAVPTRCAESSAAEPTLDEQIATLKQSIEARSKELKDLTAKLDALLAARDKATPIKPPDMVKPTVPTTQPVVAGTLYRDANGQLWQIADMPAANCPTGNCPTAGYTSPGYTGYTYTTQYGTVISYADSGACGSAGASDGSSSGGGRCGPIRRLLGRCK